MLWMDKPVSSLLYPLAQMYAQYCFGYQFK